MGLRDVQASGSPLLVRRGGCAIKKNAAKPPYSAQTGWSLTNHVPRMHSATWLESDHPVRAFQRNGTILLMARPPLLTRRGLLLAPARARENLVALPWKGARTPRTPLEVRALFACHNRGLRSLTLA